MSIPFWLGLFAYANEKMYRSGNLTGSQSVSASTSAYRVRSLSTLSTPSSISPPVNSLRENSHCVAALIFHTIMRTRRKSGESPRSPSSRTVRRYLVHLVQICSKKSTYSVNSGPSFRLGPSLLLTYLPLY
jgi:hypothetical protein